MLGKLYHYQLALYRFVHAFNIPVRAESTHSEQQLELKSEQRSENSHSTICLRRKLMRNHRNGHGVYKTIILFPIPCAWPIVSMGELSESRSKSDGASERQNFLAASKFPRKFRS